MSEINLIDQARQGDAVAWGNLVRQHQEAVFRLAYLLLGNADEAKDVAQETFIRAFQALDGFDSSRPLRPWLLRIANNLARNRQRSMGRYLAAIQRWFRQAPAPIEADISQKQLRQQEAQTLWQAVQRLNSTDQEIIYLRYFLELSIAEAAEAANIAPGTVKSRLHRALKRLRRIIINEFPSLQQEHIS